MTTLMHGDWMPSNRIRIQDASVWTKARRFEAIYYISIETEEMAFG